MYPYPEAVQTIVRDYLERVSVQLRTLPPAERGEFLRELESHIYEGYHEPPEQEPVARILSVLRRVGEPAEVVAGRLPESMVRTGAARKVPVRILAGVLIALFGVPLGIGGVAVVAGMLVALAGMVFAWYAFAGAVVLSGAIFVAAGLIRLYDSNIWDALVSVGVFRFDGGFGDALNQLPAGTQALFFLLCGALLAAAGLGLLWLGRYLWRGIRFLFNLAFDGLRRAAGSIRGQSLAPAVNRPARPVANPVPTAGPSA